MRYIEICPDNSQRDVNNPYNEEFFEEYSIRDCISWDTETGYIRVYDDKPYLKKIKVKYGR